MILGMVVDGDLWSAVAQLAVAAALAVVFHRLRDAHVLAEDPGLVFSPALAVGYLVGTGGAWAVNAWALVLLARGGLGATTTTPALGVEVVGSLAWFVVVLVVWNRINRADAELHGSVARVGRFLRVAIGTAVPAAVRSLRGLRDPWGR